MIDIICRCGTCRYSEYNKCCNEKIKEQFKRISTVKEVYMNPSNCSELSEEKWSHDVE